MAGESPDRSKQRESSAEPTPGSASPVPEARDPRLAVSREKDSAPSGVDTATKILSVREAKPPAPEPGPEDTALREAVSSWVRDASPTTTDAPANSKPTAIDDGGSESGAGGTEGSKTGTDEAKAEAAGATSRAEEANTGVAGATSGAEAKDVEVKADAGTEADSDAASDTDAEADAGSKADTKGSDAAARADGDAKAKAGTEAGSGAAAQADGDTKAKADTKAGHDAQADGHAKADADTEAGRDAQADAGTEADSDAASGTDAEADAGAKADTKAGSGAAAQADGDTKADADTEAGRDAQADGHAKADAGTEAGHDAQADAGEGVAEADVVEDGPEAADGGDAPQGPTSADDESRTGGAGGNTAHAEGEAEAGKPEDEPEAPAAVDQPTAVFKTAKPKPERQVDQPTTMLKLGPKLKTPESDPERTSKFVALKNDMTPAAKPEAKPQTTPAAKPDVTTPVPHVGPERTTQQPLPPKPPLDLLAELTNTPPPPETAVRTVVRRVKIWTPLVLVLAIVFAVVQTFRPLPDPTLDLTAKDTYTFTGGKIDIPWPADGQAALDVQGIGTFGSSGDQKPVPIASVAKVMTAYIILRDHALKSGADGPKIEIDKAAEQQSNAGQESTVSVTAGDSISQREALESILIASANNIARRLARWDAGSEKAFVEKMNATAKSLGMTNTTYTDPSGLTNTTVSTAVDQVKLAKAAMTEPAFREVAAMMSYRDYKGVTHSNWNRLVGHNNVVGIKTGTTTSALGNLVFAAKQQVGGETRTVVGAVIRQPADAVEHSILTGALNAADKLIRAGQSALTSATILKKGAVVGYVDDGLGGRTPVVTTKDVTAAGWAGLQVKLSFASGKVPHTAKAGTEVGSLTVGDGSAGAVKVPVALQKDLAEPGFGAKLTRLG
ncbi:D-alanyl-D-alanine carboxypeptidase [Streptomyces fodineus]|uniref:serine-type D-Ala-D-Ala carboxypeptidase n=1 Tax=Streptomyces fodineus TaxID=1904616 RepID=A0A1D7YNY0_9ACTN|nr:D-alanyl-D-alanine carboxypeptidase [Streptomyces fodineus]